MIEISQRLALKRTTFLFVIFTFSFICLFPLELSANFLGHRLPWQSGLSIKVTKKDTKGHENQVDFALGADVYASKPGTVVFVKESSPDPDEPCEVSSCWQQANVVVIQHSSNEYSWYYHLKYNSVPVSVGDAVGYGTKIGIAGNTGWVGTQYTGKGAGTHLHFMASTNYSPPSDPNNAPWPPSGTIAPVDFDEVSWSALTVLSQYTSQNSTTSNQTASLVSASPSPSAVRPGETFTISYTVNATSAMNVMLGASMRPSGSTAWSISDTPSRS